MSAGDKAVLPYAERARIIKQRLSEVRRRQHIPDIDKPLNVVEAEAVVAAWEAQNDAHRESIEDKHWERVREIDNALILGDVNKVVELLTAYEQEKNA